ncbi:MAG: LysR family transcriptional regulator [Betaproteobacteria bacterium]
MKISIDQWESFVSVVESGGYAKAGEALHKSQSTLTYSIKKLEGLLGVKVFEIRGRKAALTPTGEVLYRRGRTLLDEAARLERAARELAQGWEPELRLAVEILFPTWLLLQALGRFGEERPETRIELYESVLGGTDEALAGGRVHLAIGSRVPPGFQGDAIAQVRAVCVAAPAHPLHRLGRPATLEDLRAHRHIVVRDSGVQRTRDTGFLNERRWTVSNKATSLRALTMGMGYAWIAEDTAREEIARGALAPLALREGAEKFGTLYLMFADRDAAGPGALRLAAILREEIARECPFPEGKGKPRGVRRGRDMV